METTEKHGHKDKYGKYARDAMLIDNGRRIRPQPHIVVNVKVIKRTIFL